MGGFENTSSHHLSSACSECVDSHTVMVYSISFLRLLDLIVRECECGVRHHDLLMFVNHKACVCHCVWTAEAFFLVNVWTDTYNNTLIVLPSVDTSLVVLPYHKRMCIPTNRLWLGVLAC